MRKAEVRNVDLDKFTQKAQEAILGAQTLAGEYSHGQIEPTHLLLALLRQSDGIVPQIVQKLEADAGGAYFVVYHGAVEVVPKFTAMGSRGYRCVRE